MNGDGVLGRIVASTRERLAARKREFPLERLLASAPTPGPRRPLSQALRVSGRINVIAEIKRRSPSLGAIREGLDPAEVARGYEASGAAAVSVLTDGPFFGGSLEDLQAARAAVRLPVLRKDFIVDLYQVREAWLAGADAILLIAAVLDEWELRELLKASADAGLEALVEVHDAEELERALRSGAALVGVNNRDLRSMQVRLATSLELAPRIPDGVVAVAESGIRSGAELRRLRDAGFDAFLVGEQLMRAPDPGAELRRLLSEAEA